MDFLKTLGIEEINYGSCTGREWKKTENAGKLEIYSPGSGEKIASVYQASESDYEEIIQKASEAFIYWRDVPAPKRGEIVRQIGDELRKYKDPLGRLV